MSKYKIGVIGFFGTAVSKAGGQEAKTCALTKALSDYYGKDSVKTVDTLNWRKSPFKLLKNVICLIKECDNVLMLPAQNGVRIFVPLFVVLKNFFRKKIYYPVVGGWLPELLKKHRFLRCLVGKLDGIWVETSSMKIELETQGLSNVKLLPNFKFVEMLKNEDVVDDYSTPYRLCIFSRIMKEKGVEDAINAVSCINERNRTVVFELDIYGKVDEGYLDRFTEIQKNFPKYVKYCGMVEPEKSVDVLKNYFALLFPTHYETEGIPGTILDAYASGVPVITAIWKNSGDVFVEGKTGYGYEIHNQNQFIARLEQVADNPNDFVLMKKNCLDFYKKYTPESVTKLLIQYIS